jgi:hypothetical protein
MGILPFASRRGFHGLSVWPYNTLPYLSSDPIPKMVLRSDHHGWRFRDLGYDFAVSVDSIPDLPAPLCDLVCPGSGVAPLDQRFCLHDHGAHGVQFYSGAEDWRDSGEEIWSLFCAFGYLVGSHSSGWKNNFADSVLAPLSFNLLVQSKLSAII